MEKPHKKHGITKIIDAKKQIQSDDITEGHSFRTIYEKLGEKNLTNTWLESTFENFLILLNSSCSLSLRKGSRSRASMVLPKARSESESAAGFSSLGKITASFGKAKNNCLTQSTFHFPLSTFNLELYTLSMLLDFYYKIGFAVCHQMPSRSIFINGLKMPVDARETGIFVGFLVTLIFLLLTYPKATQLPPKSVLMIGVFATALLAFDGISSYAGYRETTNAIRLATGLPVGAFIAALIFPTYNDFKGGTGDNKVLQRPIHLVVLFLALSAVFAVIISKFGILKFILPSIIVAGILSAFILLNLTILYLFTNKRGYAWSLSLMFTIIELTLTYQLHKFVVNLVP